MSETREDVLREYRTKSPCDPRGCQDCAEAMAESMADEILRLRDEAQGVRAVDTFCGATNNNRIEYEEGVWVAWAYGEPIEGAPTIAALGLELLKQGRVTL